MIAATAAFGGVFPNLIDLAVTLTGKEPSFPGVSYLIGVLLFAILGAGVALIWQEIDLKKVFYIGVGLPSFIQVNAANISAHTTPPAAHTSILFVNSAFAEEQTTPIPGRTLTINRQGNAATYNIIFSAKDYKQTEKVTVDPAVEATIPIPDYATSLQVEKQGVVSEKEPLTSKPSANIQLDVEAKKNYWSGFYNAIGIKNTNPYQFEIKQKVIIPSPSQEEAIGTPNQPPQPPP